MDWLPATSNARTPVAGSLPLIRSISKYIDTEAANLGVIAR
jgi:hypothetical protein